MKLALGLGVAAEVPAELLLPPFSPADCDLVEAAP
jgi:hypothetical protein